MLHSVQLPYHLVWVGGLETISSQRLISGFVVGRLAESQAGSLLSNFSTFLGQTPHPNFRGGGAAISIERGCIPCPADSRHGTLGVRRGLTTGQRTITIPGYCQYSQGLCTEGKLCSRSSTRGPCFAASRGSGRWSTLYGRHELSLHRCI